MDKIIYFNNNNQKTDCCSGQIYQDFLDYAFAESDYFMLVYVNYFGKGFTKKMKSIRSSLRPFQVKARNNPSWPGVLETFSPNTTYKVIFYKNCFETKTILKKAQKLSDWSPPSAPQDLAFFKGNTCWFYSVGHEKIAAIIHATERDLDFLETKRLASRRDAHAISTNFYDAYDEELIRNKD